MKTTNIQMLVLVFLSLLIISCTNEKNKIVLFDTGHFPDSEIESQNGGTFKIQGNYLLVETDEEETQSGVLIKGSWDLSQSDLLVFKMMNSNSKEDIPITIMLQNPDAIYTFIERAVLIHHDTIPAGKTKQIEIKLPPNFQNQDLVKHFKGTASNQHGIPVYLASGIFFNSSDIIGLSVLSDKPGRKWSFGVGNIVASTSSRRVLPDWMKLNPEEFFPFIDKYGQFKYMDWPGKTKSDIDLAESLKRELSDIEAHPEPANWSKYGGWKNELKRQKATGHFYVKKIDGKWWMVDPEGYLCWSHGPCRVSTSSAVTPLDNRKFYFEDLPEESSAFAEFYFTHNELLRPYFERAGIKETYDFSAANLKRKYGENWRDKFTEITHKRLRSWGMNTVANSSDKAFYSQAKTPYLDRINLKSPEIEGTGGLWWPFRDPFHPEFRTGLRDQLLERGNELDDPMCIGYFVDNEINWGGPTSLAEWTLQTPSHQPAKMAIINHLKKKYKSIEKLNEAWKSNYHDWEAMLNSTETPPADSRDDCIELSEIIIEEYYKNIREVLNKVAPNKLYLGSRFYRSFESVVRIAAKYSDVLSWNIYSNSLSGFNRLPDGIDKPVMIGEFHFGALDRGLFHPANRPVDNQEERGKAYYTYIESGLRHPNIVGAHWFQYGDPATTGRFDGNNKQMGLVDVCDNPYPETIAKIREIGYNMYQIRDK
jgi:hypothetical protein